MLTRWFSADCRKGDDVQLECRESCFISTSLRSRGLMLSLECKIHDVPMFFDRAFVKKVNIQELRLIFYFILFIYLFFMFFFVVIITV